MGTVIVALPPVGDRVYKVSSEEIPHLTLAYLGDDLSADDQMHIVNYVQHAARELSPFGLTVDYRDTLGADQADVLFFEKDRWDYERVADFRHYLLMNDTIKKSYDSVPQFDEFTPHLTLGYPEKPAKELDDDYDGRFHYVSFDRIAVWVDDFDGPEFRLRYSDHGMDSALAMSDEENAVAMIGESAINSMFHYGVKGMRWGVTTNRDGTTTVNQTRVRKSLRSSDKAVTVSQRKPGTYVKAKGGKRQTASTDAVKAQASRQKAKRSTTDSLSTKELKDAIERMRLEQEFAKLDKKVSRRGQSFAARMFREPQVREAASQAVKKLAAAKS